MMVFEPDDYRSDDLDNKCIKFEAEKELFNLFKPKYGEPNPRPKMKDGDYVPFMLFDESKSNFEYKAEDKATIVLIWKG